MCMTMYVALRTGKKINCDSYSCCRYEGGWTAAGPCPDTLTEPQNGLGQGFSRLCSFQVTQQELACSPALSTAASRMEVEVLRLREARQAGDSLLGQQERKSAMV